jgi:5'-3' exonuclease
MLDVSKPCRYRHVIIDGNCFTQIAMHGAKNASSKGLTNEQKAAMQYSDIEIDFRRLVQSMLRKIMQMFKSNTLYYAAWDSAGSSDWRRETDDGYKAGRTTLGYLYDCLDAAKDLFAEKNITAVQMEKTEADDLIYALSKVLHRVDEDVIIVTRDRDMIQVVQDGYAEAIWEPAQKKYLDIPPYSIVDFKCLVGDASDHIAGVKGVGEKTALKMIEAGFDRKIITEQLKIVCIPENPRHEEYVAHCRHQFNL